MNDLITDAANQVFLQLRHGQPVYLYFLPSTEKQFASFTTIREGQNEEGLEVRGYQLVFAKPFRGDKTKDQIRHLILEWSGRAPLLPYGE